MRTLLFFILLFVAAVCLDVAWFSLYAGPYFIQAIGPLLRQTSSGFAPDLLSAIAVYVLMIVGIYWFVIPRAYNRLGRGAWWGAAYGFIVYGIYDLTNYATFASWPAYLCLLDLGWGIVLCAILSTFAVFLQNKFNL